EVEDHAAHAARELDELAGHRLIEAVDARDAVADREHGARLGDVDLAPVLLDLALQDVGDFGRLDVERHRSTFSRELRAELRELGAQAAVEDEVADAGDEAADQLRVDADFEIDRATDAARERLANAVELRGVERRRRQELAADAAGGLLGEPREL